MRDYVAELIAEVKAKNPAEPEFHQAVQEVLDSLSIVLEQHPEYRHEKILQRITVCARQFQIYSATQFFSLQKNSATQYPLQNSTIELA